MGRAQRKSRGAWRIEDLHDLRRRLLIGLSPQQRE
jgi:hypothetical protein